LTDSQGVSNPASRSLSFSEINHPGKTPLLADCEAQNGAGEVVGSWYFIMTRTGRPPLSGSPRLSFRHNDQVQFLFADGSSGSYTLDEVYGNDGILPWSNE
jgi:prepilin-type processing-associated H-X9-DG protein